MVGRAHSKSRTSGSAQRCRPRFQGSWRCIPADASRVSECCGGSKGSAHGKEPVLGLLRVEEGDRGQDSERVAGELFELLWSAECDDCLGTAVNARR